MPRVAIRVLGCGDAFGSGGRLQTCFFVTAGRDRFLIDCGATAMVAMRRFGVDPATIDRVFLSHLHGDHFGGLPFLLLEAQHVSRRRRPLTIVGPAGTRERLLAAQEALFPGSSRTAWRFPLEFVELVARPDRDLGWRRGHRLSGRTPVRLGGVRAPLRLRRAADRLFRRHRMDRAADRARGRQRSAAHRVLRLRPQGSLSSRLRDPESPPPGPACQAPDADPHEPGDARPSRRHRLGDRRGRPPRRDLTQALWRVAVRSRRRWPISLRPMPPRIKARASRAVGGGRSPMNVMPMSSAQTGIR